MPEQPVVRQRAAPAAPSSACPPRSLRAGRLLGVLSRPFRLHRALLGLAVTAMSLAPQTYAHADVPTPSGAPAATTPPVAPAPTTQALTPKMQADTFEAAGRKAYAAGQYQQAHDAFARAFSHVPKPGYLYNMGRCMEKLAKYGDAVRLLQRYLDQFRRQNAGTSPANVADVTNLVRTLRQRAFESLPEVVIGTNPSGATVAVLPGGKILGSTPLVTHLSPGTYKLKMVLARHTSLEADLVVPETGKVRAVFSLKPIVKLAALSFWCNVRGAKIAVNGKIVAITPFSGTIQVPPGRHQVSIQKAGYGPIEEIVSVPEAQELHINYVLELVESTSSWRAIVGWPLLVGGLAGIGGGIWSRGQAELQYAGSPKFKVFEGYQNLGYGAGGASVAAGLGLIIWDGIRSGIPKADRVVGVARVKGKTLRPMGEHASEGP